MRRILLLLLPLSLLSFICSSGASDPTGREIIDGELIAMALPHDQLGPAYLRFETDSDNGLKSAEDRVASATDKTKRRADLQRAGFVRGYDQNFVSPDAIYGGSGGVLTAATTIDLYKDASGAAADWTEQLTKDFPNEVGKKDDKGVTLESLDTFDAPKIADDAAGLVLHVDTGSTGLKFHGTVVYFRRGRIIAGAMVARLDDKSAHDEAVALAKQLDKRILAVLNGDIKPQGTPTPRPTPKPLGNVSPTDALNTFRASYELSIQGQATFTLRSEGTYVAPDRYTCTVTGLVGGVTMGQDQIVGIGRRYWFNDGSGMREISSSSPVLVDDLPLCPSVPVFWLAYSDFSNFRGFPDRKELVSNTVARHFAVDEALHSAAALGLKMPFLEGVTINSFDIWIADQGNWPVALQMDFSGDARALSSSFHFPGEAPAGQARITIHVAITQPNDPHIDIQPPVAPRL